VTQLTINEKGVGVRVSADGLPSWEGVVPAPFMSETDRQRVHREAIEDAALRGFMVVKQARIRNVAFDKRGEKTTLKIEARTCRNRGEALALARDVVRIIEARKVGGGE
jgi:hypothetical protein